MLICIWPLGFRLICIDTTGLLFKAQSFSCRPAVLHIFTLCLHMLHQALFWDMGAYHCFISLVKWHFYIKVPHCFICAYLSRWWKEQQCVHLQQGQTNLCTQCVVCIVSRKVQPHLWMLDRCTCPCSVLWERNLFCVFETVKIHPVNQKRSCWDELFCEVQLTNNSEGCARDLYAFPLVWQRVCSLVKMNTSYELVWLQFYKGAATVCF